MTHIKIYSSYHYEYKYISTEQCIINSYLHGPDKERKTRKHILLYVYNKAERSRPGNWGTHCLQLLQIGQGICQGQHYHLALEV